MSIPTPCSRLPLAVLLGISMLVSAAPGLAQTGTVSGSVVDAETGSGLGVASVQWIGPVAGSVATNAQGQFQFSVPAGTYSLVVMLIGYEAQRLDGIRVEAGGSEFVDVQLRSRSFVLNPIIVTASRREEKALDAPASVAIVGREEIRSRIALTPIDHVKSLPGLDIVQTGLQQTNVVARGFNNVFSGALMVLTDNRIASVPSLRFNSYSLIPTVPLDVERIEVVLGPGAALYGPNSASGVLHVITSSPIDDPGFRASLAGGERSVFQGAGRYAGSIEDRIGVRVSGSYVRGDDWEYVDPVEEQQRTPDNPRIGRRDFQAERWTADARMDFRLEDRSEVILSGGVSHAGSSIEMTALGAAQAVDWQYRYLQARYLRGRLFTQAFLNSSDAGDTYLLRTGQGIVDRSRMAVGQVQYGVEVGDGHDLVFGLDLQWTEPRTEGTLTGRFEDDDSIVEVGGYLHGVTHLTDRLELVGALRVDHHNRLEDLVLSPRVALVYRPEPEQNLRLTFNRAFSTPTTNNLFLDVLAARIPVAGPLGYDIRLQGVPPTGLTFEDRCSGGLQDLCMRSPFQAGQLPANAWVLWNGALELLPDPGVRELLRDPGTRPGDPTSYGSVFRRFDPEGAAQGAAQAFPLDPVGPAPIDRMRPSITNTIEVGYKGILGDRFLLSADLHWNEVNDFVGPARIETPSVFLDPQHVQAFVMHRLGPAIQAGLVDPAVAQEIVQTVAQLPAGTVVPDQADVPDLLLTFRNFADVRYWGIDVAGQLLLNDRWTLSGSASFVNEDCFAQSALDDCSDPLDIALNAPRTKGSLTVTWLGFDQALTLEGRGRTTASFPMNSGVYVGRVDGYSVFDANVSYRMTRFPGATVALSATNLLDNRRREFVGAPEVGRMVLLRLQYAH